MTTEEGLFPFCPAFDRVVVEKDKATEKVSESGIVAELPGEVHCGTVKAVGPGKWDSNGQRISVGYQVGDRVAWALDSGAEIEVKDQRFFIFHEDELLGTFRVKE